MNLKAGAISGMALAAVAASAQTIPVTVNGAAVDFHGRGPIMRNDRVLVPLRGVLEQMGVFVQWNPETQTVKADKAGTRVRLRIGDSSALVNGQSVSLDTPAKVVHGRTMVPLRFIGEALGETVDWDPLQRMVQINFGPDNGFQSRQAPVVTDSGTPTPTPEDQPSGRPSAISSPLTFPAGTVLSVGLQSALSSKVNQRGDRFTVTSIGNQGIPLDTHFEGVVVGARAQAGEAPGMLEIRFDKIDLPDGKSYPISGNLIDMNFKNVGRKNHRSFATPAAPTRTVFAGYGKDPYIILGITGTGHIEDTSLRSLFSQSERTLEGQGTPHDVELDSGQNFGIRLLSPLTLSLSDVR
jgi:hypothetical protein